MAMHQASFPGSRTSALGSTMAAAGSRKCRVPRTGFAMGGGQRGHRLSSDTSWLQGRRAAMRRYPRRSVCDRKCFVTYRKEILWAQRADVFDALAAAGCQRVPGPCKRITLHIAP